MSRFRTVASVAIFLFGSTFLWFLPSYARPEPPCGVTNMATNLTLHAIGIAVPLLVLVVPSLAQGPDRRLAGQQRSLA